MNNNVIDRNNQNNADGSRFFVLESGLVEAGNEKVINLPTLPNGRFILEISPASELPQITFVTDTETYAIMNTSTLSNISIEYDRGMFKCSPFTLTGASPSTTWSTRPILLSYGTDNYTIYVSDVIKSINIKPLTATIYKVYIL